MKSIIVLIGFCLLTSCSNPPPKLALKCNGKPEGRTLEERQKNGDACFRRGTFIKSKPMEW